MGQNTTETFAQLVELIDQLGAVVQRQNTIIAKLLNENIEKENFIESMINEGV